MNPSRRKIARKLVTICVTTAYFSTQVAFGALGEANIWSQRRKSMAPIALPAALPVPSAPRFNSSDPALASLLKVIPAAAASIREIHEAKNFAKPAVLLIQDVHMEPEAQRNVATVIDRILAGPGAARVAVEGAFGPFDFGAMRLPYPDIVKEVADDFLKQNFIGAASYVGITHPGTLPEFTGIDDQTHYDKNVEAYRVAAAESKAVLAALQKERDTLQKEIAALPAGALKDFISLRDAYRYHNMGFGEYARLLSKKSDAAPASALKDFLEAHALETSINFTQADAERRVVLERLLPRLTKLESETLLQQSVAIKDGRLAPAEFYGSLEALLKRRAFPLSQTPAFAAYLRYVLLSEKIEADRLLDALDRLEAYVAARVAVSDADRDLVKRADAVYLMDKLVGFEMTPKEWEKGKKVLSSLVRQFSVLEPFLDFYEEADARSERMAENLLMPSLRTNKLRTENSLVLLVGGFHTPKITALLRQRGVSYIVASPKMTKIDSDKGPAYLSVFTQEKTPLEKLFSGEKLSILPTRVNAGSGLASTLAFVRLFVTVVLAKAVYLGRSIASVPYAAVETVKRGIYNMRVSVLGKSVAVCAFIGLPMPHDQIPVADVAGVRIAAEKKNGFDWKTGLGAIFGGAAALASAFGAKKKEAFVSPALAGFRNVVGTFLPFFYARSKNDGGVGDFFEMRKAIDVHAATGQNLIQFPPFNLIAANNSPYSVQSSKALETLYISIPALVEKMADNGYSDTELQPIRAYMAQVEAKLADLRSSAVVNYDHVRRLKEDAFRIVWSIASSKPDTDFYRQFVAFAKKNDDWLSDHMLYVVLKKKYMAEEAAANVHWTRSRMWDWRLWKDGERDRTEAGLLQSRADNNAEVMFQSFLQFAADDQYASLQKYAASKGVQFMVDMPFSPGEADVWINRDVFGLKKENGYRRLTTQGVPPESAYPTGQYWQFYPFDWSNPKTIPFVLDLLRFNARRASYVRLDHVLGFYRTYHFTEDVNADTTLEKLKLLSQFQSYRTLALKGVITEDQAVTFALNILKERIRTRFAGVPADAVSLLFDAAGELRPNCAIQIAREVPFEDHGNDLPEGSAWKREVVVEKKVFNDQPKWDFIRVTPDASIDNDKGFMREYLFGVEPPQAGDSIRLGYYKLATGEQMMSEFLRVAQEEGIQLVWETLGTVPPAIQESVERLGGTNYVPLVWGDDPKSTFHVSRHIPNSFVTIGLQDSVAMKVRWENELNRGPYTEQAHSDSLGLLYKSNGRMAVPTWIDLLGGDERINEPGKQENQWQARLPMDATLDDLKEAAEGRPSTPAAERVIERIRKGIKEGNREKPVIDATVPKIINVNPEVDGKEVVQLRRLGAHPFQVDAFTSGPIEELSLVVSNAAGVVERVPMEKAAIGAASFASGLPAGVSKWTAEFSAKTAGRYTFQIETDDGKARSKTGHLLAAKPDAALNPLNPLYLSPGTWAGPFHLLLSRWLVPEEIMMVASVVEGLVTFSLPSLTNGNLWNAFWLWLVINLVMHLFGVYSVKEDGSGWELLTLWSPRGPWKTHYSLFAFNYMWALTIASVSLLSFFDVSSEEPRYVRRFLISVGGHWLLNWLSTPRSLDHQLNILENDRLKSRWKPAMLKIRSLMQDRYGPGIDGAQLMRIMNMVYVDNGSAPREGPLKMRHKFLADVLVQLPELLKPLSGHDTGRIMKNVWLLPWVFNQHAELLEKETPSDTELMSLLQLRDFTLSFANNIDSSYQGLVLGYPPPFADEMERFLAGMKDLKRMEAEVQVVGGTLRDIFERQRPPGHSSEDALGLLKSVNTFLGEYGYGMTWVGPRAFAYRIVQVPFRPAPGAWASVFDFLLGRWLSPASVVKTAAIAEGAITFALPHLTGNVADAFWVWLGLNLVMHALGVYAPKEDGSGWEILRPWDPRGPPGAFYRRFAVAYVRSLLSASSSLLSFLFAGDQKHLLVGVAAAILPHLFLNSLVRMDASPRAPFVPSVRWLGIATFLMMALNSGSIVGTKVLLSNFNVNPLQLWVQGFSVAFAISSAFQIWSGGESVKRDVNVFRSLSFWDKAIVFSAIVIEQFIGPMLFVFMMLKMMPHVQMLLTSGGTYIQIFLGAWVFGISMKISGERLDRRKIISSMLLGLGTLVFFLSRYYRGEDFVSFWTIALIPALAVPLFRSARLIGTKYLFYKYREKDPSFHDRLSGILADAGFPFGWAMALLTVTLLAIVPAGELTPIARSVFANGIFSNFEQPQVLGIFVFAYAVYFCNWKMIYWLKKHPHFPLSSMVLIQSSSPAIAWTVSYFVLGTPLDVWQIVAAVFIFAGSVWQVNWNQRAPPMLGTDVKTNSPAITGKLVRRLLGFQIPVTRWESVRHVVFVSGAKMLIAVSLLLTVQPLWSAILICLFVNSLVKFLGLFDLDEGEGVWKKEKFSRFYPNGDFWRLYRNSMATDALAVVFLALSVYGNLHMGKAIGFITFLYLLWNLLPVFESWETLYVRDLSERSHLVPTKSMIRRLLRRLDPGSPDAWRYPALELLNRIAPLHPELFDRRDILFLFHTLDQNYESQEKNPVFMGTYPIRRIEELLGLLVLRPRAIETMTSQDIDEILMLAKRRNQLRMMVLSCLFTFSGWKAKSELLSPMAATILVFTVANKKRLGGFGDSAGDALSHWIDVPRSEKEIAEVSFAIFEEMQRLARALDFNTGEYEYYKGLAPLFSKFVDHLDEPIKANLHRLADHVTDNVMLRRSEMERERDSIPSGNTSGQRPFSVSTVGWGVFDDRVFAKGTFAVEQLNLAFLYHEIPFVVRAQEEDGVYWFRFEKIAEPKPQYPFQAPRSRVLLGWWVVETITTFAAFVGFTSLLSINEPGENPLPWQFNVALGAVMALLWFAYVMHPKFVYEFHGGIPEPGSGILIRSLASWRVWAVMMVKLFVVGAVFHLPFFFAFAGHPLKPFGFEMDTYWSSAWGLASHFLYIVIVTSPLMMRSLWKLRAVRFIGPLMKILWPPVASRVTMGAWAGVYEWFGMKAPVGAGTIRYGLVAALVEAIYIACLFHWLPGDPAPTIWLVTNVIAKLFGVLVFNPDEGGWQILRFSWAKPKRAYVGGFLASTIAEFSMVLPVLFAVSFRAPLWFVVLVAFLPHATINLVPFLVFTEPIMAHGIRHKERPNQFDLKYLIKALKRPTAAEFHPQIAALLSDLLEKDETTKLARYFKHDEILDLLNLGEKFHFSKAAIRFAAIYMDTAGSEPMPPWILLTLIKASIESNEFVLKTAGQVAFRVWREKYLVSYPKEKAVEMVSMLFSMFQLNYRGGRGELAQPWLLKAKSFAHAAGSEFENAFDVLVSAISRKAVILNWDVLYEMNNLFQREKIPFLLNSSLLPDNVWYFFEKQVVKEKTEKTTNLDWKFNDLADQSLLIFLRTMNETISTFMVYLIGLIPVFASAIITSLNPHPFHYVTTGVAALIGFVGFYHYKSVYEFRMDSWGRPQIVLNDQETTMEYIVNRIKIFILGIVFHAPFFFAAAGYPLSFFGFEVNIAVAFVWGIFSHFLYDMATTSWVVMAPLWTWREVPYVGSAVKFMWPPVAMSTIDANLGATAPLGIDQAVDGPSEMLTAPRYFHFVADKRNAEVISREIALAADRIAQSDGEFEQGIVITARDAETAARMTAFVDDLNLPAVLPVVVHVAAAGDRVNSPNALAKAVLANPEALPVLAARIGDVSYWKNATFVNQATDAAGIETVPTGWLGERLSAGLSATETLESVFATGNQIWVFLKSLLPPVDGEQPLDQIEDGRALLSTTHV